MLRRINLFAGPGCGKSTMAAAIFSRLKAKDIEVELIQEYVKAWAYEGRMITRFDQLYLFAKQLRQEDLVLRNTKGVVISDSPVELSICYAKKYGFSQWEELSNMAKEFEQVYPSLNFFLERGNLEYVHEGRYENYEQAVEMDEMIREHLETEGIPFITVDCCAWGETLEHVRSSLGIVARSRNANQGKARKAGA